MTYLFFLFHLLRVCVCVCLFIIKLGEQEIKYEDMAKCIFVIDQKMYQNYKGLRA